MASKKKEREALEKIADLIESVGGDESYIGMAFKGCYIMAQENIENDWACCMMDERDNARQLMEAYDAKANEYKQEAQEARDEVKRLTEELTEASTLQAKTWNEQQERIDEAKKDLSDALEAYGNVITDLKKANDEIIKLKAKLYDMMMKED